MRVTLVNITDIRRRHRPPPWIGMVSETDLSYGFGPTP
jgi:hypothetical protein